MGLIPKEVEEHGDGWYKVGEWVVEVIGDTAEFYVVSHGLRFANLAKVHKDLTWERIVQEGK